MTKLLSCPFCGQQDAFVEQLDSDASVVICQGMVDEHSACLARGPVGVQQSDLEDQPGRDAAIAEWNRRAQPAEAEGVRDYLTEFAEGEVEAKTAIEELQDALSAVTAERDRLRKDAERYRWASSGVHEAETLVSIVNCHGGYAEKVAERVDVYRDAAMAAKEA